MKDSRPIGSDELGEHVEEVSQATIIRRALTSQRALFQEAETKNFASDETGALHLYNQIIASGADSLYGHLAAGQIAVIRGSTETALNEFLAAQGEQDTLLGIKIIYKPEDSVSIHLGLTYRKMRKYDEAIEAFETVNPKNRKSKNAFAYAGLSSVYRAMLDRDKDADESTRNNLVEMIEGCVNLALNIDPKLGYARSIRVKLYQIQGSSDVTLMEKAYNLAQEILEEEPGNWYIAGTLGDIAAKNRNLVDAIKWFDIAIATAPKREIFAKIGLAKILKDDQLKGKYLERSKQLSLEILDVNPQNTQALTTLGDLALRENKYDEAKRHYELALGTMVDYAPDRQVYLRTKLSKALLKLDRVQEAREILKPILKITNQSIGNAKGDIRAEEEKSVFWFNDGQRKENERDYKAAIASYRKSIDRNPIYFTTYTKIYPLLLENKRTTANEVIALATQAIKNGENSGCSMKAMGEAYHYLGNDELSLKYLKESLTQNEANHSRYLFPYRVRTDIADKIKYLESILAYQERAKVKKSIDWQPKLLSKGTPHFQYTNNSTGQTEIHSVELIKEFLPVVLEQQKLPIGKEWKGNPAPITQIGKVPTFLVAKTGVGKTVTVPTKVLIDQCEVFFSNPGNRRRLIINDFPQVFVVVPRIPIADKQMHFMNDVYQDFLKNKGIKDVKRYNLFGCINSASGKVNSNAPIVFVTTGIFESMAFNGQLDPIKHRVIIDEAHVTIEQNPGVEMAIAIARQKKVIIDYMSATVDTGSIDRDLGVQIVTADNIRYPILLSNLKGTLEDNLLQLVQDYLINPRKELYPSKSDPQFKQVTVDLFENRNRPRGMLVIVNSHQSETSDTRKFCRMIEEAEFNQGETLVSVFPYASPIARDRISDDHFQSQIASVEEQNGLYVIISTNVVEMGVTFDSLDYLVTMDSEMITVYQDGGELVEMAPLGINALYQRIGRVGRKRSGMAFIVREYGAEYTDLTNEQLRQPLKCQKIKYPIAKGNLQKLALYSFREAWLNPQKDLKDFGLPSLNSDGQGIIDRFFSEREKIAKLGLTDGYKLNALGMRSLEYLPIENLDYKRLLAIAEAKNNNLLPVIMTMAATSGFSLGQFLQSGTFFPEGDADDNEKSMYINHCLTLPGCLTDTVVLMEVIQNTSSQDLQEALTAHGIAQVDAIVINDYLDNGYSVIEISKELEDAEEEESTQTGCSLVLRKNAIHIDFDSEALTIYRIISYFYNMFASRIDGNMTQSARLQLDTSFNSEAYELGLNPVTIRAAIKTLKDLSRCFGQGREGILASERGERVAPQYRPNEQATKDCLVSQLLWRLKEIRRDELSSADIEYLANGLLESNVDFMDREGLFFVVISIMKELEYDVDERSVKTLIHVLIQPAVKEWQKIKSTLEYVSYPPQLPILTQGMARHVLEFLRSNKLGEEIELTFKDRDDKQFPFKWVGNKKGESGKMIPIVLNTGQSSLYLPQMANTKVRIRAILQPAYLAETEGELQRLERGGKDQPMGERKSFRIFKPIHSFTTE